MRPGTPTVRLAAVIAVAALVLHELRYLIGFGDHAGEALAARGHAYLPFAGGVAGLLLALAGAQLLVAIDRARRTARGERAPSFARLWLALAAVLLAVYSGQELLEAACSAAGSTSARRSPSRRAAGRRSRWRSCSARLPRSLLAGASRAVTTAARRARPSVSGRSAAGPGGPSLPRARRAM